VGGENDELDEHERSRCSGYNKELDQDTMNAT
jgi:hypothetical protein